MPKPLLVSDSDVIEVYSRLNSASKVSELLGIGKSTTVRILRRNGVPPIPRSEIKSKFVGVYDGSTDEIIELYKSGLSYRDIAKKIGRSTHVVARRVKAAGIARKYHGSGPDHSMWKGGKINANEGYFRVWVPEGDPMASMRNHHGYILEHRLVMARKLGRPLLTSETVHHIDGDKSNNNPDNLQLRQGKHGKHVVMVCMDCGSHHIGHAKL